MYVRNSRKAHAHCGHCIDAAPACELPLSGRYTAAQSLAVSAAVMLFCRKNRKKPASRRARAVMLLAKNERASIPPALRHLFNPALYRRRHAACKERKASVPPASLKIVGASLRSPLRFQPWRKAQQQHIPVGHCQN